jgi:hypothetical protein
MPIVGRELVISGRDTSTLLDFVEEPSARLRGFGLMAVYSKSLRFVAHDSRLLCGA